MKLVNVLLSLLVVGVLSGCHPGIVKPDFIHRPASLILPVMVSDVNLSCLTVDQFSRLITRDVNMFNRLSTLEGQIDAHNVLFNTK